jgi:SAM-dependent methyltransferase
VSEVEARSSAVPDDGYTADDHEFRDDDAYAKAKYAITLRWLGPAAGRSLRNVGCGSGLFNEMAAAAGFVVEGWEPDGEACARARASSPPGVVVHHAGLDAVPADRGADVVVLHDVLEHIDDDAGAVRRLRAILAPTGTLVVSVPAHMWLFGYHDEQLGHFRRYTPRTLRAVLEPEFRVRRLRSFGFAFIPVTLVFSRWRRAPYPTGAAGKPGLVGRVFRAACGLEARLALPLGTSVISEAVPRS